MKKTIWMIVACILLMTALYSPVFAEGGIDYLALVNKQYPLPEGWEDALETVKLKNSVGDDVEVEKKTYDAYLELAKELYEKAGIHIELDSGRRSVEAQQEIWDRYIEKYGEEYTRKTVSKPGFSEHHTGLAVDLYFITSQGTTVYYNEDLTKEEYSSIWSAIHAYLADYGFILRYPEGRSIITGYAYEPWHIRYIGSPEIAQEIMTKDITLEEYLGMMPDQPIVTVFGDAAEAGLPGVFCTDDDFCSVVVPLGEKFFRITAEYDEEARAKWTDANSDENIDRWEELAEEWNAYQRGLPVTRIEEITGLPLSGASLQAMIGKPLQELAAEGFEWYDFVENEEVLDEPTVTVRCGLFLYDIGLEAGFEEFHGCIGNGTVGELTVKSIASAGVSFHAADPAYPADGSFIPPVSSWESEEDMLEYAAESVNTR